MCCRELPLDAANAAVARRNQMSTKKSRLVQAAGVLAAIVATTSMAASSDANTQKPLTVVELFQSQGCSDCPPANANLIALSDRSDLLTLSLGVTYWDKLGWKDTFASPQYTSRQWDYARAFHRTEVFTPEVVVNGRADVVGRNRPELEALIGREANRAGPVIRFDSGTVTVGSGDAANAQVWLVRFDPSIEQVPITRGENSGATLPHKNVVKELVNLGGWNGMPATYRIPASARGGLREAVLVQAGAGGSILSAARN
jgi:hypothetical protein